MDIRKFFGRKAPDRSENEPQPSTSQTQTQGAQQLAEEHSQPSPSSCEVEPTPSEMSSSESHPSDPTCPRPTGPHLHEPILPPEPYQPDPSVMPVQELPNKKLKFQVKWFKAYPWLHYDPEIAAVLCYTCVSAKQNQLIDLSRFHDQAFLSTGFKNWKKAVEKFTSHEKSQTHKLAVSNTMFKRHQESVEVSLVKGMKQEQLQARSALLKIISSLKFLSERGLAVQGKTHDDGNFMGLLKLRAEDVQELEVWLRRKHSYTSTDIQNDILQTMGNMIVRHIVKDVNENSIQYGITVDGTQDIQGNEQEAICVRYVSESFDVKEDLLGLYNINATTGHAISNMVKDVLLRLQLPIENLRSQTYDGASNMSGHYSGCQAEIKKSQPLARFVHCGAHISHLITSKAVQEAEFMKNSLDYVHELGKMYNMSGKFKQLYLTQQDDEASTPGSLKPICPTRWLTRLPAVSSVLKNYAYVLDALQTASAEFGSSTASKANGLHSCLSTSKCVLGLYSSSRILQLMETLNKSLQGTNVTVSGMLASVDLVKKELQGLQDDGKFEAIFREASDFAEELGMAPLQLPRQRKVPKRYQGDVADEFPSETVVDHFRKQFLAAIDKALTAIDKYFSSPDLQEYKLLSEVLLSGKFNEDVVSKYPELPEQSLRLELEFYSGHHKGSSIEEHRQIFSKMDAAVRKMFPGVERLLRLLIVSPASSCEAERSFSALRRLKTWLRSTMSQKRLNHTLICHVHKNILQQIPNLDIAREFVGMNDSRLHVFGKF